MKRLKFIISLISICTLIFLTLQSCEPTSKESSQNTEKNDKKEEQTDEIAALNPELTQKIAAGKEVFSRTCITCHQVHGKGIPNAFPPLAGSDFLNADTKRAIGIVINGRSGEIVVNGNTFNGTMTPQSLSSEEIANVLTYVYNSWGNNKTEVTTAMVEEVKNAQ